MSDTSEQKSDWLNTCVNILFLSCSGPQYIPENASESVIGYTHDESEHENGKDKGDDVVSGRSD